MSKVQLPIPRHEPEVVQFLADKNHRGDPEKVSTTSIDSLTVNGIKLESRYGKAHEYDTMKTMAEALPVDLAHRVHLIWCDSPACSCYCVMIPDWDAELALAIGRILEEASRGHNGITLYRGTELFGPGSSDNVHINPNWFEDFEGFEGSEADGD